MNILTARSAILLSLRLRQPDYGLSISARLEQLGFSVRFGSLYPALKKLEGADEIYRLAQFGKPDGRPRIYYQLTLKGRKEAYRIARLLHRIT